MDIQCLIIVINLEEILVMYPIINMCSHILQNLIDKYQAGAILNHVASQIGGKGGGRADMAQGGGTQPEKLSDALNSVKDLIKKS